MSSRAPTKNVIIAKSQAIADSNYDRRHVYKLCKVDNDIWWCWCFDMGLHSISLESNPDQWPWSELPRFMRVRKLTRKQCHGLSFIWCDCGFYDRCGIPCSHVFRLVNDMSINMMHVRHWKVYDAHYGDTTKLGRLMIQAQEEHFMNEGMGVCITDGQNKNLAKTPNEMKFERKSVHLCQNTSIQDVAQAKFVITRSEQSGCTLSDFINYLNQKKDHHLCSAEKDHTKSIEFETNTYNDSDVEEDTFTTYRQTKKFLSPVARRLQSEIDFSQQSMDLLCDHSIEEIRKNIITTLDNVISSPRMPSEYVKIFQARALEKLKEMDSELSALKTELYKDLKSKHCGGMKIIHKTSYEFACDEGKSTGQEKRKKNGLDY
jgi:hypothetical protein